MTITLFIGYDNDRSFVLSPGRKSFSMSNLVGDHEDGDVTRTSSVLSSCQHGTTGSNLDVSTSMSNLHRMKAFLSLKHLDQVQISLVSKQKVRNILNGAGSEGELVATRPKIRECLRPEDRGKINFIRNVISN